MNNFLGQSAIEYLMTYGWMLLVVAIAGGAIFSIVGENSIESIQGFDSNELQISEFGMTLNSLQTNVEIFGSDSVTLKEVKISDSNRSITIPLNHRINPGDSSVLNLPHVKQSNGDNTLDLELVYDSGRLEDITASGTVTGGIEIDNSLSGYWPLAEEQANQTHVLDISENLKHGVNNAVFTKDGDALKFDGGSKVPVNVKNGDSLDLRESITITAQITVNSSKRQYIVSKNVGGGFSDQQYLIGTNGGNVEFVIGGQSYTNNAFPAEWEDTFDQPKFVALTWDGEEATVYGDNNVLNTYSHTGEPFYRPNFTIGARVGSDAFNWEGTISDVRIYDRALSEREVKTLYRNQDLIK